MRIFHWSYAKFLAFCTLTINSAYAGSVTVCAARTLEYDDDDCGENSCVDGIDNDGDSFVDESRTGDDRFTKKIGPWPADARGSRLKIYRTGNPTSVYSDTLLLPSGPNAGCMSSPVSLPVGVGITYTAFLYAEAGIVHPNRTQRIMVVDTSLNILGEVLSSTISGVTGTYNLTLRQTDEGNVLAVANAALTLNGGGITDDIYLIQDACPGASADTSCAGFGGRVYIADSATRIKSVIAHEIGHELGMLADNLGATNSPNADYSSVFDTCVDAGGTINGVPAGWNLASKEYQSAAASEGFAEFYAALTFNESGPNDEARLRTAVLIDWDRDGTLDSQYISLDNAPPKAGMALTDYLDEECDPTGGVGMNHRATAYDWARFFWDFQTDTVVSNTARPSFAAILAIWNISNPSTWNPTASGNAVDYPPARLETAAGIYNPRWNDLDNYNGINR